MKKKYIVKIQGMGGHASMPKKANNPILIAAGLVTLIGTGEWLSPEKVKNKRKTMRIEAVGIDAGEKGNIIPDEAEIQYYLDADTGNFSKLKNQFVQIVNEYAESRNAKAEIRLEEK